MATLCSESSAIEALRLWDDVDPVDPINGAPWDADHVPSVAAFIDVVRKELEAAASKQQNNASNTTGASMPPPQQSQVLAKMRSLVSQEKVRFQLDGFDLDLTYITPNVIAMGFPSSGKEAYYRNPVEEVERFFNTRHPKHYRIYNLCSEREYDLPLRFHGNYKRFPFDDHNAPSPIKLIPDFVRDAQEFLRQHVDNVVAIHCKAGKGRTGVMVSCLLRALEPNKFRNADGALEFFGNVRTADGKGVTIPSQKRYVRYWDLMMQYFGGREPPGRTIQLQSLRVESTVKISGPIEVYFTVDENNKEKMDSRRLFPAGGKRDAQGNVVFAFRDPVPSFSGDLRFIFYQRNALLSDEELFHFWVNTSLCNATERFSKAEGNLDGRVAKSKDVIFAPNLAVEMSFGNTFVRPSAGGAAASSHSFRPGGDGGGDGTTKRGGADEEGDGGSAAPSSAAEGGPPTTKEKGFFKKLFGGEDGA